MNNSTIYISRRCKHCQELLILIHKNKDILNFRIVDVDKEPFSKSITTTINRYYTIHLKRNLNK